MLNTGTPPNLWDPRVAAPDASHKPIAGPMAAHVGPQYTVEEIWNFYRSYADVHASEEDKLRPLAARIRAFDVPMLAEATFSVNRLSGVGSALESLLRQRLPGFIWTFPTMRLGRVKKYGILHEIVSAPMDEATREPMAIEIYGQLVEFNGQPAGMSWFRSLQLDNLSKSDDAVLGTLTFRLVRGTYANTRTPGIGVPFYM